MKGIFTISLDFELFWGVRDHRTIDNYGSNIRNVHSVVPRLLELFGKYGVHATWATVGFLFHDNKKSLLGHLPQARPSYIKADYDPYTYIIQNELQPEYHFAPSLVEMISNSRGQEVGTHTYCHFYTLERSTSAEEFRQDIKKAMQVASQRGIQIRSIVFPRNQYSKDHVYICEELGIKVYRGNEESGVYRPVSRENEKGSRRAVRFIDAYANVTGHHCHRLPQKGTIINVPASRFLRPYDPRLSFLDGIKLRRIRNSLDFAAGKGMIFHLWWHPHNFGSHMDKNFEFLEKILIRYRHLHDNGKMESLNMFEIYSRVNQS